MVAFSLLVLGGDGGERKKRKKREERRDLMSLSLHSYYKDSSSVRLGPSPYFLILP
jgi:hypothetical protein